MEYKYHIVFIPKFRRKKLYKELRQYLGEVFKRLADHVHMLISIPPKYAVSQVIGLIKDKNAIHLARVYGERKRSFVEQSF